MTRSSHSQTSGDRRFPSRRASRFQASATRVNSSGSDQNGTLHRDVSSDERNAGKRSSIKRKVSGLFHDLMNKKSVRKPAAIIGSLALILTVIVALNVNSPDAQAEPVPSGDPGTVSGYVYTDKGGYIEDFNKALGDKAIAGVKMNAMLVKKDGTVISNWDQNKRPIPFTTVTNEKGKYGFDFRPAMQAAYGPDASGDQLKVARYDRIRIWPDESNYKSGGALEGLTAKRLNGGTRLMPIDTLTLSYLGTTNYWQGSISDFNMAFRPRTERGTDANDWGAKNQGKHDNESNWEPTLKHDVPVGQSGEHQPYLCGAVYSDMVFRFDRWNGRNRKPGSAAYPDKVVPGVRVAVTTYARNGGGRVTNILKTRYDYTDKDGRWCIKWKDMNELKKNGILQEQMMVTIDLPKDSAKAKQQFDGLKAKYPSEYEGVTPLTDTNNTGLPDGFSSLGANGWYGTLRPVTATLPISTFNGVGYDSADASCSTRGSWCLPDLVWRALGKRSFVADGADLGIIPEEIEADFSRYSQETGTERKIDVTINNTTVIDKYHQVVMVAQGQDPTNPDNWVAASDVIMPDDNAPNARTHHGEMTIPAKLPVGNYSLYTYSVNLKKGGIQTNQLHDVDPYRITDTKGFYYTDKAQRDQQITKIIHGETPAKSVTSVRPGTKIFAAFDELGDKPHTVKLVKPGTQTGDNKITGLTWMNAEKDVPRPYTGQGEFTVEKNQEPGQYELLILNGYGEEVDRKPLTVTGPQMSLDPPVVKPGDSSSASLTDLNPDTEYELIFTPNGGKAQHIAVPAHTDGTASVTIPTTKATNKGPGKVILVKKGSETSLTQKILTISNKKVYGPRIILPAFQVKEDGLLGTGDPYDRNRFDCTDDADCARKYKALKGTHVYRLYTQLWKFAYVDAEYHMNIHAYDPAYVGDEYVSGGTGDKGTWTIDSVQRLNNNGPDGGCNGEQGLWHWNGPDDFMRDKCHEGINKEILVTLTYKSKKTGLSDTQQIIFWTATGVKDQHASKDWKGFAAVLNQGEKVPEGKYCINYNGSDAPASDFTKSRNEKVTMTNPWPAGLDIDPNTGCLVGTPTELTPNQDFVEIFARATVNRHNHDHFENITRSTPSIMQVAVREKPDLTKPTIEGISGDKAVANNGTVTVEQGQTLPLIVTGKDNKHLTVLNVTSDAHKLPAGITVPDNNPELSDDTVNTQASKDFTAMTVAEDAKVGVYPVTFMAMDKDENIAEYTVNIEVVKKKTPPVFGDGTPPNGKVALTYGENKKGWTVPVSDADEGIASVEVSKGKLPKGLRITTVKQSDGSFAHVISGTPEEKGSFTFSVTATDLDGTTATKEYTIVVDPAPKPEWTDSTPADNSTITLEVGKEIEKDKYVFAVKPNSDGLEAQITTNDPTHTPDNPKPSLPDGLTLNDGVLSGTPTQVNSPGVAYDVIAYYGNDSTTSDMSSTRRVTIHVQDTTPPAASIPEPLVFKAGETLVTEVTTHDNSGEPVSLSNPVCAQGDKSISLDFSSDDPNTLQSTAALTADQIGTYQCHFDATDAYSNKTTKEFTVKVIREGPRLQVSPNTQTVETDGQVTPITDVLVHVEEGATLDVSDCVGTGDRTTNPGKLPRTITWDADASMFTGTVKDIADKTYQCEISAQDSAGKVNKETITIHVRGPVISGPKDKQGRFYLEGRVGEALNQTPAFEVKEGSIDASEALKRLEEYFEPGLKFEDGKFVGTPKKTTYDSEQPATITVKLKGSVAKENTKPFSIPVIVNVIPKAEVTGIPTSAGVGQSFPLTVKHPQNTTYTVYLCKADVSTCDSTNAVASQTVTPETTPAPKLTIPSSVAGEPSLKVAVVSANNTPVDVDNATITLTEVDVVTDKDEVYPSEVQGGTALSGKLKGASDGVTYLVKLCKKSDTKCENPIGTKDKVTKDAPSVADPSLSIPVIGSTSADPDNEYELKVFTVKGGQVGSEPVVTKQITASAGKPKAADSTATLVDGTAIADGTQTRTVNVHLVDAKGNPVSGQVSNLSLAGLPVEAEATVSPGSNPGDYVITVTSTKADTFDTQVKLGKENVGTTLPITFVAGDPDATQSSVEVTIDNEPANGAERDIVTVTLKDANGNLVSGKLSAITKAVTDETARAVFVDSAIKDNKDGTYTFPLTSNKPGTASVSMKLEKSDISDSPVTITFVPATVDATKSKVSISTGPKPADGTGSYTVTVELKDKDGHVLSGMKDDVAALADPATGVSVQSVSESNDKPGTYTFNVTSTSSGTKTITVSVNDVELTPVDAVFEPLAPASVKFENVPTKALPSGEEVTTPGTIVVRDENGNLVKEGTKVWVKVPGNEQPVQVTTNSKGKATIPAFTPGTIDDKYIKVYKPNADGTAADTSEKGTLGETEVRVVAGVPDASKTTFTASDTAPVESTTVTLGGTVKDKAGNPVPHRHMTVTLPDGATVAATTNAKGELIPLDSAEPLEFTAGQPEVDQIAKLHDGETAQGDALKTVSVTPVKDPAKTGVPAVKGDSLSKAEITTDDKLADNQEYHTITVTLKDVYGDPVSSVADKVSAELSDNQADGFTASDITIGAFTEVGNTGVYQANVTSTKIGVAALEAAYDRNGAKSLVLPQDLDAKFVQGALDSSTSTLEVTQEDGTAIGSDGIAAGTPVKVIYTPKDAQGHTIDISGPVTVSIPGTTKPVSLTKQDDNTWVATPSKDSATGEKAPKVKIANDAQTITSQVQEKKDSSPVAGPTATIKVIPGAPSTVKAADAPKNTQVTSFTTPTGAVKKDDTNKVVTVERLTDAYGNQINDTSKLTATVAKETSPGSNSYGNEANAPITTTSDGKLQVTVPTDTEGKKKFQFSYDNTTLGDPVIVDVNAKTAGVLDTEASFFEVTRIEKKPAAGKQTPAVANGTDAYKVTVTLKDKDGAAMPDSTEVRTLLEGIAAKADDKRGYEISTLPREANSGVWVFKVTSTKDGQGLVKVFAGPQASQQAISVKPKTDAHVTFVAGAPANATFDTSVPDKATSGVESAEVTNGIIVKDANGNNVASGTKIWVTLPGSTTPVEVTVGKDGHANVPAYTPAASGNKTITVHPAKANDATKPDINKTIGSHSVTVSPGAASTTTTLELKPKQPVSKDQPTKPIENTAVTVEGTVKDDANNVITDHNVTVVVENPDKTKTVIEAKADKDGKIVDRKTGQPIDVTVGKAGETTTVKVYDGDKDGSNTSDTPLKTATVIAGKDPAKQGVPVFDSENGSLAQITTGKKVANGKDAHTVTVRLKDTYGDPVKGQAAKLSLAKTSDSELELSSTQMVFGAFKEKSDGVYEATVTSKTSGTGKLEALYNTSQKVPTGFKAEDDSKVAVNTMDAAFGAGRVDLKTTTVEVFKQKDGTSDGSSFETTPTQDVVAGTTVKIKVTPKDANGNIATVTDTDNTITVHVPGVKNPVTLTKQDDGSYIGTAQPLRPTVNDPAHPENSTNKITFPSGSPLHGKESTLNVTVGNPAQATVPDINGTPGKKIATPGDVVVTDAQGNLIPEGKNVFIKVPGSDNYTQVTVGKDGRAAIPGFTPTADANQVISVATTANGKNADGTSSEIGTGTVSVNPDAPSSEKSTITLTHDDGNGNQVAGNPVEGQDVTVTGTIKDAYDNVIPDRNVTVVLPDGSVVKAKTDDQGNIVRRDGSSDPITFPTADQQDKELTVKVFDGDEDGTTPGATPIKEASITPGKDPAKVGVPAVGGKDNVGLSYAQIDGATKRADGSDRHMIAVTLKDKYGDPVTGHKDHLRIVVDTTKPASDGFAEGTNLTFSTFKEVTEVRAAGKGIYQASVTSTKAGTPVLQVNYDDKTTQLTPVQPVTNDDPVKPRSGLPAPFGDVTGPEQPSIAVTEGKNADNTPNGEAIITITPSDADDVKGKPVVTIGGHQVPAEKIVKNKDGSYSVTVPATQRDKDQEVTAFFKDAAGNDGQSASATIPPVKTADVTEATAGGERVVGKVDKAIPDGSTVTVKNDKGEVIGTGTVKTDPDTGAKTYEVIYDNGKEPADGSQITVTVTDKNTGVDSSPKTTTVDAKAPTVTVDPTNGKTVSGTVDDKSATVTVTYTDAKGKKHSKEVTVNNDGTFNTDLQPPAGSNTTVTVTATDKAGNAGKATEVVDTTAPTVTVNETEGKKGDTITGTITGDASSDITVTITYRPEGSTKDVTIPASDITVNDDGTYSTVLPQRVENATTITVTATDKVGNKATKTTEVNRSKPILNVDKSNGKTVTGTTSEDATVTVTYTDNNGEQKTVGPVTPKKDKDGNVTFEVALPNDVDTTKPIKVTAEKEGVSTEKDVVVDVQAPATPRDVTVVDDGSGDDGSGGQIVTGKTDEGGLTIVVTLPDGSKVTTTTAEDGSFHVAIPSDKRVKEGEKIAVTATDEVGNTSDPAKAVVDTKNTLDKVAVDETGTKISGKADPGSSVVITDQDGKVIGRGQADKSGNFVVTVTQLHDGDVVTVTATDPAGHSASVDVSFTAKKPAMPKIDQVDGDTVSGSAPAGTTVHLCVTRQDGKVTCKDFKAGSDGVSADGDFALPIPGGALKPGERITVSVIDPLTHAVSKPATYTEPVPDKKPVDKKPAVDKPAVEKKKPSVVISQQLSKTGSDSMVVLLIALLASIAGLTVIGYRKRNM